MHLQARITKKFVSFCLLIINIAQLNLCPGDTCAGPNGVPIKIFEIPKYVLSTLLLWGSLKRKKPNNECNCATLCSAPKHAKGTNNVFEIHWIGQFCENDPMKSSCTKGTTLFYTEKSVLHRFLWYFWGGNKVHSLSQFIYRLFKVFFKINI